MELEQAHVATREPRVTPREERPRTWGAALLVVLCFFLPSLAVLRKDGLSIEVLWAFLLQLLGHVPGVFYGLHQALEN